MIAWLWRMIVGTFGCQHVWAAEKEYEIQRVSDKAVIYIDKHLCCTKCGDWKRVRL